MRSLKVGDRVVFFDSSKSVDATSGYTIVEIDSTNHGLDRCKISNWYGSFWSPKGLLQLDMEYYRNEKIDEILTK